MNSGICYIVGAGEGKHFDIPRQEGDLLIAADGGYIALQEQGVDPDVILGDFDSLHTVPGSGAVLRFPPEKDDTDMMLAVKYGLEQGYQSFRLYGGLGGRLSHTLANIQILAYLSRRGCSAWLLGDHITVTAVSDGRITFDASYTGSISVFSHSTVSHSVLIQGLKYPVCGDDLTNDVALGISNEFIGRESSISVEQGTLIIVMEPMFL